MGVDDVVRRLHALGPYGDAMQKVCDATDWSDPRFLLVVREALKLRPRIHVRQWEHTAAFIGLADAGKLQPQARGIGFGSGREPLTFAVGARVAHLTATDLYEADTAWTVARTSDPLAFVLGAAPAGFPRDRLAVHHMDMREISYPDASFDFCYSISSIEHIGDDPDFLRHFQEVRRVLKPDGLYAVTTEVLFGPTTRRTRGNYAFAVADLLALFAKAGLQAAPEVDMRLADIGENDPRSLVSSRHADPAEPLIQGLTVREQAGVCSAPVLFLLRPVQGTASPVTVKGLEQSHRQTENARVRQRTRRFSDWMRLNPWGGGRDQSGRTALDLWTSTPLATGARAFSTSYFDFGKTRMEFQLVLVPSPACAEPSSIEFQVIAWRPGRTEPIPPAHVETVAVHAAGGAATIARFAFDTEPGCLYAVTAVVVQGPALFASIDLQARRAPGAARG